MPNNTKISDFEVDLERRRVRHIPTGALVSFCQCAKPYPASGRYGPKGQRAGERYETLNDQQLAVATEVFNRVAEDSK